MSFGWGDTSDMETQLTTEKTCGIGPIINDNENNPNAQSVKINIEGSLKCLIFSIK